MPEPGQTQTPKNSRETRQKGLFHPPALWWRGWARPFLAKHKWSLIGLVFVTAALLGFTGLFGQKDRSTVGDAVDVLYRTVQLFWMNAEPRDGWSGLPLELAQLLAVVFFVVLSGRVVWRLFPKQFEALRLARLKDHAVVCGLGHKGIQLVTELSKIKPGADPKSVRGVVVVELDGENNNIAGAHEAGANVVVGNATDPAILLRAGVGRAKYIMATCTSDETNLRIAEEFGRLPANNANCQCLVHIASLDLISLLRDGQDGVTNSKTMCFNMAEIGALTMATRLPLWTEDDLGQADKGKDKRPRRAPDIVVVGLGPLGQCLVSLAARWWLGFQTDPICGHLEGNKRLQVTVIDEQANDRLAQLKQTAPWVATACDLKARDMQPAGAKFFTLIQKESERKAGGETALSGRAYVCLDDDSKSLAAALALARREKPRGNGKSDAAGSDVAVMLRDGSICTALGSQHGVSPLLWGASVVAPELVIEPDIHVMARTAHMFYVLARVAEGNKYPCSEEDTRNGNACCPWDSLHEFFRKSNIDQARAVDERLTDLECRRVPLTMAAWRKACGSLFTIPPEKVEDLAEKEHNRWMKFHLDEGWTQGGKPNEKEEIKKDFANKLHPDLLPWKELSGPTKEKDRSTMRQLPGQLAAAGFLIVPNSSPNNA